MSVYLDIVDHDELFKSLKNPPTIVNEFDINSSDDKERLNKLIYTSYSDDSLEAVPSCDGGHLQGEYNVGLRCPECGTLCLPVVERPLESLLWISPPKGVTALVNPEVWKIFSKHLTVTGVNLFEWMVNPTYRPKIDREPPLLQKLKSLYKENGLDRGINFFHDHFDGLFEMLIEHRLIQSSNQRLRDHFIQFVQENRHKLFSQHIPIPSKLMFITEQTPTGIYADTSMTQAIDAIRTVCGVENSVTPMSVKLRQTRAMQAVQKLSDYYEEFFKTKLGKKEGWFRKHVYGSRLHFSFRAVISSISEPHHYTELHLPWSMSVLFFKLHLIAKLRKRGFTPNESIRYLYEHTLKYDFLLDELFQELLAEAPGIPECPGEGGVPVILQRNPTLTRLSAQRLRVTKIKTDPNINTVSVSTLVLAGMNADFDGKLARCHRKTSLIAGKP